MRVQAEDSLGSKSHGLSDFPMRRAQQARMAPRRQAGMPKIIRSILSAQPTGSFTCPSCPNFPLPAELRNRIYEYLLHAPHIQQQAVEKPKTIKRHTTSSGAVLIPNVALTYKFHPGITAVNKEMRREAEDILYRSNAFVMVEHNSLAFANLINAVSTPIVAEGSERTEKLESLCVLGVNLQNATMLEQDGVPTVSRIFVLLEDLPKLCQAMQMYFAGSTGTSTAVVPPDQFLAPAEEGSMELVLTNLSTSCSKYLSPLQIQQCCLEPFLSCHAGQLNTFLVDFDELDQGMANSQILCNPARIWFNAWLWWAVQTVKDAIAEVEDMLHSGRLYAAYFLIGAQHTTWERFASTNDLHDLFTNPYTEEPMCRWMIMLMDLMTVSFALCLRLGDTRSAKETLEELRSFANEVRDEVGPDYHLLPDVDPESTAKGGATVRKHVGWLWCEALILVSRLNCFASDTAMEKLEEAKTTLDGLSKIPNSSPRLVANTAVVKQLLADASDQSTFVASTYTNKYLRGMLDLARTSQFEMFSTPGIKDYKVPEGMVGWTDANRQRIIDAANG